MRDDVAHPPKTTVPQWESTPPALNTSATRYTLFSLDSDRGTVTRWARQLTSAAIAYDVVEVDGPALPDWMATCTELIGQLASSHCVGWRIGAAGDEVGVLAVAAAAHAAGLIDAEITLFAESRRRRLVSCTHCKATVLAATGPTCAVDCPGCRRRLVVRAHVSRRTGSYLGVAAP